MKKVLAGLLISALAISPLVANAATTSSQKTASPSATVMASKKVDVNHATVLQLEKLPGIGPKIAAAIVKNRPYKNGLELQQKVKGIGAVMWKNLEPLVKF